jgi:hypothetical protein
LTQEDLLLFQSDMQRLVGKAEKVLGLKKRLENFKNPLSEYEAVELRDSARFLFTQIVLMNDFNNEPCVDVFDSICERLEQEGNSA